AVDPPRAQARRDARKWAEGHEQVQRGAPAARRARAHARSAAMTRKLPEPLDLRPSRDLSIRDRAHKSTVADFREPAPAHATVAELIDSLPHCLGARSLRELAAAIAASHRDGRHVVAAMGGHVVKVGCGPILVDLMERGIVTALAVNGAFAIHDYEIALEGETSEYVDET